MATVNYIIALTYTCTITHYCFTSLYTMEIDGPCYPCQPVITHRGNFFSDNYFESARKILQELMSQMQNRSSSQFQYPPGKIDYLLAELGAWQQSGQNLGYAMGNIRHDELFTTVFRFEPDIVKMLVDVKGFQPFNMSVTVNNEVVELKATREEASSNNSSMTRKENCIGYASRTITRKYILPQKLMKECVQCSLSADGILFISAPWQRC